jgi:MFS transporter, DHA1 family, multidrug resistance protein
MRQTLRDAAVGQIARLLGLRRTFGYPEEHADFELPPSYNDADFEKDVSGITPGPPSVRRAPGQTDAESSLNQVQSINIDPARTTSLEIVPVRTKDGITLVDWYTEDDPANPQNWPNGKKIWIAFLISIVSPDLCQPHSSPMCHFPERDVTIQL